MSIRAACTTLRGLLRSTLPLNPPHLHLLTRALSTSPLLSAAANDARRAFKRTNKKGAHARAHKKMAPGEALDMKRRVALTNPNANLVNLEEFSMQTLETPAALGKVYDFPLQTVEKLRTLGMFWPKRNWEMFKRPASLVRGETMEVGNLMRWVERGSEEGGKAEGVVKGENGRWAAKAVVGKRKAGKSVLLMQAAAYAFENKWVVISVPEARDLVISHTAYEQDRNSGLWLQNNYVADMLERTLNANPQLKQMPVTIESKLTNNQVPKNMSLGTLLESGIDDAMIATNVFNHLLLELSKPTAPPVLFTYDNLNQICQLTLYRDPDFKFIHGFDFALSKFLLDLLNLKRGIGRSLTLAATSLSSPPKMRSVDVGLYKITPDPYEKLDFRVVEALKNVQVLEVGRLEQKHGRELMEYVRKSGLLLMEPGCGIEMQDQFAEKYAVSGGVAGEFLETILAPKVML